MRYTDSTLYLLQDFSLIESKTRFDVFRLAFDGAVCVSLHIPSRINSRNLAFIEFIFESIASTDSDLQRAHF